MESTGNDTRIVSDFDEAEFGKKLMELRVGKGISRQKLGEIIGRNKQQIGRYEGIADRVNYPPLLIFIKICEELQIAPNDLLSFKTVDVKDRPEGGKVYKFNVFAGKIVWICPECGEKNITYDEAIEKVYKTISGLLKNNLLSFECENCNSYFDKLSFKKKK